MPTAPFPNSDRGLDRVVDLAPLDERAQEASDLVDLADEVAGEVDDVSCEIAERARAGLGAIEAPDLGVGIAPVLEVAPAEVADLAELAGVDQLPCEPNGRDEAVVERAQVLYAGRGDTPPDLEALVRVAAERLLADHVLPRLRGGDRGLRMERVRSEVVEELDTRVGHDLLPRRRPALEAVAPRGLGHGLLVPAGDRYELRHERRRPGHVRDLSKRVRVGLAHERVAEHSHADLASLVAHRTSFTTRLPGSRVILGPA